MARKTKSSKSSQEDESIEESTVADETVATEETAADAGALSESDAAADLPSDVETAPIEDAVLIEEAPKSAADVETPSVPGAVHAAFADPVVPTPPTPSGPSTTGLVFGGVLAGAIGFLIATFAVPDAPVPVADTSQFEASVQDLETEIVALKEALAATSGTPDAPTTDLGPMNEALVDLNLRVGVVNEQIDSVWTMLEGVNARLETLESRPAQAAGPDGSAAMEAQLEAFRSELDSVTASARAEIEAAKARAAEIEAAAAEAAARADRDAALTEVAAAVEAGTAFSAPLARLPDVPPALSAAAEGGVPTLAALQADFPEAARRALAATQTVPEDAGAIDRATAFLRRQTNARSLSPREGNDPDAVLSRAEAALAQGDLGVALTELTALPGEAATELAEWAAAAQMRADALAALRALEQQMK